MRPRLVIGLGKDAEAALRDFYVYATALPWPFRTPSAAASRESLRLHFVKHPSWIQRHHNEALEGRAEPGACGALGVRPLATVCFYQSVGDDVE